MEDRVDAEDPHTPSFPEKMPHDSVDGYPGNGESKHL
jgi:hypothetical protein